MANDIVKETKAAGTTPGRKALFPMNRKMLNCANTWQAEAQIS